MKSRLDRPCARFVLPLVVAMLCLLSAGRPNAVSSGVVISQIYGGGGNSGATYTHDYIELFNRGSSSVSVDGWSVQYAAATGSTNLGSSATLLTPLSGVIPAGGYLLVRGASTAAVGAALPAPDVTDATPINLSATSGRVALVSATTPLNCNGSTTPCMPALLALIVDLVGYGNTPFFEGSGPTGGASNTEAVIRKGSGCIETDNNSSDFVVGAALPRNGASPRTPCTVPGAGGCSAVATPIFAIQGSGAMAAITGLVTTGGVVVGDYEGASPALRGFFLQDAAGDGNVDTSDGIFVFNGDHNSVSLGDVVVVEGTAAEFQGQTQITASTITKCGTGSVTPVDITLPVPDAGYLERFEGMLVNLPQTLTVTEHFQLARFGEVVVSSGGRLRQPTEVAAPGALAAAVQSQNDLNRLIIDDGGNAQNPDPIPFGRDGAPLSATNTLRGGDTVTGAVGVMTYTWAGNNASGNAYRVRPVNALGGSAVFASANPRPGVAPGTGSMRVASMNLLNFFNTFGANACANGLGGAPTDCRGADNAAEFARQWPKAVAAIVGSGADVVGLVELENDGYGPSSAIRFLVDQLNVATAAGTYAFVDADVETGQTNTLGTDAIKVGIIYKTSKVTAVGQTAALNTVAFVNGGDAFPRNRPALAQSFEELATGARFVLAVNHFKSKGGACDTPDAGDGQGACTAVRTAAAAALSAWLSGDPTGLGDPDVLVVGDLNAYGQEDPVTTLRQTGYVNLVPAFGGAGMSYAFDGQWGSLDHAMASLSLRSQVVAAKEWTINADEPAALDYNTDFKTAGLAASLYAPDIFRMSDHNPVLVDLALTASVDTTADASAGAHLTLAQAAGPGAIDRNADVDVTLNLKFKKNGGAPDGPLKITVHRTEADGAHTYDIKATSIVALVRGGGPGQVTIIATATIEDASGPKAARLVDNRARVRITLGDYGEPGIQSDTVGVTVFDRAGALWFSSHWNGVSTSPQTISGGNVQVR